MGRQLEGKVFDKETGQPLAFAVVAATDDKGNPTQPVESATTNMDGSFRIEVSKETHLGAKYVGYDRMVIPVAENTKFDFAMQSGYKLNPVEIVTFKDEKEDKKMIPNWVLWSGIGVLAIGVTMFIVGKVNKG